MNQLHVDKLFNDALRAELVSQVAQESPVAKRRRTKVWLGSGLLAGAGLLGVGAAAAGLFVIPGSEKVTPLASPVTTTYAGTATVELGSPPEGATGIQMELTCLTPGWFTFPDGASSSCSAQDAASDRLGWSGYTIPLAPGQDSVTITAAPEARWQLTAKYVKQERTPLGVNAKGETYGVESQENGTPDLIAVMATNGQTGYAYSKDLNGGPMPTSPEDAVKNFSTPRPDREIPVFQSDGETQIGVFMASGSGGGSPSYPTPSAPPG
ncbi:peptidase M56 family protein [Pseudarthrobacter sp. SL88]|uniref:peptidase M56 family protein n=1 Tax=Pseudarthrobacter sp. SL88 TaxID=2994666 RepID=UPI002272FE06|nr:peptidase M56 family protein [Pseudarthrobacter sp. SL88]MCY1675761.1 peptidase M56 family protein [Pseudarthrobacter sp. SL88]